METAKAKRTALRKSFTVCANNVEKVIKDEKSSSGELFAQQKLLFDKFTRLEEIQETVAAAILDDEVLASSFEKDFEEAESYRDRFCSLSVALEQIIQRAAVEISANSDVLEAAKMRLPKIELLEFLSEEKICGIVPKITERNVIYELEKRKIDVPDVGCPVSDIDILLGADNLGLIYTGKHIKLDCGLTAVGTHLGFTLMGKGTETNEVKSLTVTNESHNPKCVINMFSSQILSLDAKELWSLETIGIRDPIEVFKRKELNSESMTRFENELDILPSGRYTKYHKLKLKATCLVTNF
ncbi:hypothetical protein JTE90_009502 [Oedothorax gibbosus]|uniref:Peptidase aspartic putative domain-containing protein n=1 Tax=Oedothorax gibbosus TaxID=931172 RepID=A0AAV6UUB3_9ARAC|nr:hypothetical protein JTE90_009502 [Oedothorax gibbosus]